MKSYSKNQLGRYPLYLRILKKMKEEGAATVTSSQMASMLGNSEEQVKKDLAAVSASLGVPGKGRDVSSLIDDIENFLGYRDSTRAVLVGVGRLGAALLDYPGFKEIGFDIVAAFDSDPGKIGAEVSGHVVLDAADLSEMLPKLQASIAILCVPSRAAQKVADAAVKAGIRGIWNFAPVPLDVKAPAIAENVNLASSLAVLSHRMKTILKEE